MAVCCLPAPTSGRVRPARCPLGEGEKPGSGTAAPALGTRNGAAAGRRGARRARSAGVIDEPGSAVTHSHCLYLAVTQLSLLWCDTSCNKIPACLSGDFFFFTLLPTPTARLRTKFPGMAAAGTTTRAHSQLKAVWGPPAVCWPRAWRLKG